MNSIVKMFVFAFLPICLISANSEDVNQFLPLNFEQAIANIFKTKQKINSDKSEFFSKYYKQKPMKMIYESFEKMSKIVLPNAEMPNVTAKCSMQFVNFAKELFNKTHWAIQG